MSAKQKARLIVLPVLLTMLFVSLRYTLRPVDLYTLMPELEVDQIDVLIIRSGGGPSEDRSFTLKAEDPEFPRVLSRLEELRFKRSAMGPVIQALPVLESVFSSGSKTLEENQIAHLHIGFGQDNGDGTWRSEELRFWMDEWSYRDFEHGVDLPLEMTNGKAIGQELGESLWQMAQSKQSNS